MRGGNAGEVGSIGVVLGQIDVAVVLRMRLLARFVVGSLRSRERQVIDVLSEVEVGTGCCGAGLDAFDEFAILRGDEFSMDVEWRWKGLTKTERLLRALRSANDPLIRPPSSTVTCTSTSQSVLDQRREEVDSLSCGLP